MKSTSVIIFCAGLIACAACSDGIEDTVATASPTPELPSESSVYETGRDLPTLGRVLFYDRNLSLNNSVSCGSCHQQRFGFADRAAFSKGFGGVTDRNSMPLQNLGGSRLGDSMLIEPTPLQQTFLFWDGRRNDVNAMVVEPIINHVEMGFESLDQVEKKLSALPYYEPLFAKAFGDKTVTDERIAAALSAFVKSINVKDTKLDQTMVGKVKLSGVEQLGRDLFNGVYNCNSCHQIEQPHGYISAGTFANIGLDIQYKDNGLGRANGNAQDNGKFRIPSLRNVAVTAPYMHDGRFATLGEVIDHYSHGIANHENLDFRLRANTGEPLVLNMPDSDKTAIIAFLQTLTDTHSLTDPKFSDPFNIK